PFGGVIDSGCYPRGLDGTLKAVAAEVDGCALGLKAQDDIMAWKYLKLTMNLNNALQASCGLEADTSDIRRRLEQEAREVYAAAGIQPIDSDTFGERMRLAPPDPSGKRGG